MVSATRYMHECARNGQALAVADAERDFAAHHVERFIPRVVVWWWTAALGSCLEKDLVAAGLRRRGQHRALDHRLRFPTIVHMSQAHIESGMRQFQEKSGPTLGQDVGRTLGFSTGPAGPANKVQ